MKHPKNTFKKNVFYPLCTVYVNYVLSDSDV